MGLLALSSLAVTYSLVSIQAMRALVKSGDTAKVILFANTARSKDIYRMAGNYLQTLNWKENADLMRKIEQFYLKADALDSIASFYEACAQVWSNMYWYMQNWIFR